MCFYLDRDVMRVPFSASKTGLMLSCLFIFPSSEMEAIFLLKVRESSSRDDNCALEKQEEDGSAQPLEALTGNADPTNP